MKHKLFIYMKNFVEEHDAKEDSLVLDERKGIRNTAYINFVCLLHWYLAS